MVEVGSLEPLGAAVLRLVLLEVSLLVTVGLVVERDVDTLLINDALVTRTDSARFWPHTTD